MTEYPHVMSPSAWTASGGEQWDKDTPGVLQDQVLWNQDAWWIEPRFFRRGRIVEDLVSTYALGRKVKDDWWKGSSGLEKPFMWRGRMVSDLVKHEECREYLEGGLKFLAEHDFVLEQKQLLVVNGAERYCGRLDWKGFMRVPEDHYREVGMPVSTPVPPRGIIDQKNGPPPPEWITVDGVRRRNRLFEAYKMQRALYLMAYQSMRQHDEPNLPSWTAGLHLYDGTYKFVMDSPKEAAHWKHKAILAVRGYRIRYGDL